MFYGASPEQMKNEYLFSRRLLIIGCGGHSKVVTDIAEAVGFKDISYLNTFGGAKTFMERNVLHTEPEYYQDYFFVAIGDNASRERVFNKFTNDNPNAIPVSLIHPSSIITQRCSIDGGTVVMPLCVINSSTTIGKGVIVNTRSSIDHDSCLKDFSSLAPGVSMGGNVCVGERSAISIGASVKHGVQIGKDAVVGGASLVLKNVEDNAVVYGIPARFVRERKSGDRYL